MKSRGQAPRVKKGMIRGLAGVVLVGGLGVVASGCTVPEEASSGSNSTSHVIRAQRPIQAGATPLLESDCIDMVDEFAFTVRGFPEGSEVTEPVITVIEAVQSSGFDDGEPPEQLPAWCRYGINLVNNGAIEVTAIHVVPGGEAWSEVCVENQAGQLDEATFADGWVGFTVGAGGCVQANSTENAFGTFPSLPDPDI